MLVLSRSREQTARHEHSVAPDAGVTDRAAALPDILVSIPEASAPIAAAVTEITVKKSVFRAEVFYTDNAQEAKETVKRQKDQYRDARHVVHAFVIGESGAVLGCSDDGEPAGTAGQPVLTALKGRGNN